MHIPKTAGTSFRSFLEERIRDRGGEVPVVGTYPDYDWFRQHGSEWTEGFALVSGHYTLAARDHFRAAPTVVTVFREPVDRCLSHIKHQIEHERRTIEGPVVSDVNALIELPRYRHFLASLANLSVKYLTYQGHPNDAVEPTALSVERARRNCEEICFGFAEELGRFERELDARWFRPAQPPRGGPVLANQSPNAFVRGDLKPKNLDRLRKLNALDLQLYENLREWSSERRLRCNQCSSV